MSPSANAHGKRNKGCPLIYRAYYPFAQGGSRLRG